MTKEKKKKSKGLTARFLEFLWKKGRGTIEDFSLDNDQILSKRKILYDSVFQLQNSGAIEEVSKTKSGRKVLKKFKLSEKGMMRAAKLCMEKDRLKKLVTERRIIIFDIPEKQRFHRDYFRQLMKDLGCKMIQLSVWQADFELPEDFLILVRELGLQYRVIVYRVKPEDVLYL